MALRSKEMLIKFISSLFGMGVVAVLIMWGMSAQKSHDQKFPWKGSVYSQSDSGVALTQDSSDFRTLEACKTWTSKRLNDLNLTNSGGTFSCGTGCTWQENTIVSGRRVKTYECTEVVTE